MKFKLKDPGSAITHGIALLLAAVGAVPLIIKAARSYDVLHIVALSIFILTMVLLYAASTIYHSVDSTEKVNRRLRKMDHMMIFVMIAGSYTPVCLIVLHNRIGYILCALVWKIGTNASTHSQPMAIYSTEDNHLGQVIQQPFKIMPRTAILHTSAHRIYPMRL